MGFFQIRAEQSKEKILQNWLEVLNSAEVVTEESKAEYLSVSKQ